MKNIFYPSISKILLSLLIFILMIVLEFACSPYETHGGRGAIGIGWQYPCGFFSRILGLWVVYVNFDLGMTTFWVLNLLLLSLLSYIISCLIIRYSTVLGRKK